MVRFFLALALLAAAPAIAADMPPMPALSPHEADFAMRDFKFASGETLPELRIHYTTLGTPARDAAGHVTNAVLILHGTGGDGHQFLLAAIRGRAVRARRASGPGALFHHPAGRYRAREILQAQRRAACALPALRL